MNANLKIPMSWLNLCVFFYFLNISFCKQPDKNQNSLVIFQPGTSDLDTLTALSRYKRQAVCSNGGTFLNMGCSTNATCLFIATNGICLNGICCTSTATNNQCTNGGTSLGVACSTSTTCANVALNAVCLNGV